MRCVGLGAKHQVIAKPAPAVHWQYHVEMVGLYVMHPAVDVTEIKCLLAVAIPVEFARESSPIQFQKMENQVSVGGPRQGKKHESATRTYPGKTDDAEDEYPAESKMEERRVSPLAMDEICVSEGRLRESSEKVEACLGASRRSSK